MITGELKVQSLLKLINWREYNNELAIDTAVIGDSIVREFVVDGTATFSISGGLVHHFCNPWLLEELKLYLNIIIGSLGGNDLRSRSGVVLNTPQEVFSELKELMELLKSSGSNTYLVPLLAGSTEVLNAKTSLN